MEDLGSFLKIFGPYLIPTLTMVGLLTVIGRWPRIKQFFFGATTASEPEQVESVGERRRHSDPLLEQLIRQNAETTGLMIQVVKDNTAALQAVSSGMDESNRKLDKYHDAIRDGFSAIHGRINTALEKVR